MRIGFKRIMSMLIALFVIAALIPETAFADNSPAPIMLAEQRVIETTNSGGDIVEGNWTDLNGNVIYSSLRFWVAHRRGYTDTESVTYDVSNWPHDTLTGIITAEKGSAADSVMKVNIYVNEQLAYTSGDIDHQGKIEQFSVSLENASQIRIECTTETTGNGYCIVYAQLENSQDFSEVTEVDNRNVPICTYYFDKYGKLSTIETDDMLFMVNMHEWHLPEISLMALDSGEYELSYNKYGELTEMLYVDGKLTEKYEFKHDVSFKDGVKTSLCSMKSEGDKDFYPYVLEVSIFGDAEAELKIPVGTMTEGGEEYPAVPYLIVNRYGEDAEKGRFMPSSDCTDPDEQGFFAEEFFSGIMLNKYDKKFYLHEEYVYDTDNRILCKYENGPTIPHVSYYIYEETALRVLNFSIESMLYFENGKYTADNFRAEDDVICYIIERRTDYDSEGMPVLTKIVYDSLKEYENGESALISKYYK